jgi:hypothetical protein
MVKIDQVCHTTRAPHLPQPPDTIDGLGRAGFAIQAYSGRTQAEPSLLAQSSEARTAQRSKPVARVKAIKPSYSLKSLNGGAIKGGGGHTLNEGR